MVVQKAELTSINVEMLIAQFPCIQNVLPDDLGQIGQ